MSSPSSQDFESYVPVYDAIPEDWEEARNFIVEQLKRVSNAINLREIGWFLDEELLSGKQFIPGVTLSGDSQQYRTILRKVIDFGALPNTGNKAVAHGITVDNNFTLMQLYAAATNPTTNVSIPIPFASGILTENVKINMDTTNINITTFSDRTAFTRCFVVVEYIQEL